MNKGNRSGLVFAICMAALFGVDVLIWLAPLPLSFERRQFMSGCLTASGYSDEAQQHCYQHFLQYEAVKARGWKPAGDPA
ncbi:hypothetical protein [Gluconobacter oxydans]|uniref:hypothetical protein n=1 Tax=Gluconobacter oxydans TaxID=442 RepID=UPI0039ECD08F